MHAKELMKSGLLWSCIRSTCKPNCTRLSHGWLPRGKLWLKFFSLVWIVMFLSSGCPDASNGVCSHCCLSHGQSTSSVPLQNLLTASLKICGRFSPPSLLCDLVNTLSKLRRRKSKKWQKSHFCRKQCKEWAARIVLRSHHQQQVRLGFVLSSTRTMIEFETATHIYWETAQTHSYFCHLCFYLFHANSFQAPHTPANGSAQTLQICYATWFSYSNKKGA